MTSSKSERLARGVWLARRDRDWRLRADIAAARRDANVDARGRGDAVRAMACGRWANMSRAEK